MIIVGYGSGDETWEDDDGVTVETGGFDILFIS